MNNTDYHIPVMKHEAVSNLLSDRDGIYVDATLGYGGHSRHILEETSSKSKLFAIDKDIDAIEFNKNARRIQRLLIGHAEDIDVDSSGRILISKPLREYASLSKKIILIGQGEKFEIWNQGTWNENVEMWREEATSNDDEEALSDLSI